MSDMTNAPQWRAWCFERAVGGLSPVPLRDMPVALGAADMLMQFIMTGSVPSAYLKSPAQSSEEPSQYRSGDPQFETGLPEDPAEGVVGSVSPLNSSFAGVGESTGELPTPSCKKIVIPKDRVEDVTYDGAGNLVVTLKNGGW